MLSFAEWFATVYQRSDEGRSAAVLRLSQASDVSMPAVWRGLRGSVLSGKTVAKLLAVAGEDAFDGMAVIRAPHVPPQKRGKHKRAATSAAA